MISEYIAAMFNTKNKDFKLPLEMIMLSNNNTFYENDVLVVTATMATTTTAMMTKTKAIVATSENAS